MDRAAAAVIAVAFAAWMGWMGYVRSEEWIKTGRRWRKGMTGDGYAKWAREHDGESAEVLLSAVAAVATALRLATGAADKAKAFVARRAARQEGDPAPPDPADEPAAEGSSDNPPDPAPGESPASKPSPEPSPDPAPGTAAEPPPTPSQPDSAPPGDPMPLTNQPHGEIIGLRAVLAGWSRLITSGEGDRAQADQLATTARKLTEASEGLCDQINKTLTVLGQQEAACYQHRLEPAALTLVHEAMEAAAAALNAQRRAHNSLGAAVSDLRVAASSHAAAVTAFRATLDYFNRTHRLKAEVEATTGARSDRDFGTS
ncbi:hypothetical protein [Actinomadura litoris]|uniref:hypothetical protein n=1 Tax=Actinomadura litoris TaxID=2678616 RepID=UPI001FA6EBB3|nr:hypothetical protein [Actinomadura litoris]